MGIGRRRAPRTCHGRGAGAGADGEPVRPVLHYEAGRFRDRSRTEPADRGEPRGIDGPAEPRGPLRLHSRTAAAVDGKGTAKDAGVHLTRQGRYTTRRHPPRSSWHQTTPTTTRVQPVR